MHVHACTHTYTHTYIHTHYTIARNWIYTGPLQGYVSNIPENKTYALENKGFLSGYGTCYKIHHSLHAWVTAHHAIKAHGLGKCDESGGM
jgi:hypothetical protein